MLGDRTFRLTDDPGRAELRDDVTELIARLAREDYPVVDLDDDRLYDVGMVAAPVFGADGMCGAHFAVAKRHHRLVAQPRMVVDRRVPEVLVRIDDHPVFSFYCQGYVASCLCSPSPSIPRVTTSPATR